MRALYLALAAVAATLCWGPAARAASCDSARLAVMTQCGCSADASGSGWTSRGHYVSCVRSASNALVNGHGIAGDCKTTVDRCASRSVCGTPGAVTCVVGGRCIVTPNEDRCTRRGGVVSTATSCCDVNL